MSASWTIGWLWSSGAVSHLVWIGERMVFSYVEWALYRSSLYTNGGGTVYSTSSETGPSPKLAFAMLLGIGSSTTIEFNTNISCLYWV